MIYIIPTVPTFYIRGREIVLMRMKEPMNTFTKNTGYGTITLKHETKTTELTENKSVTIHFVTKKLEMGGTHSDPKTVLAHSTSKDKVKNAFEIERRILETNDFDLEDVKDLEDKMRCE